MTIKTEHRVEFIDGNVERDEYYIRITDGASYIGGITIPTKFLPEFKAELAKIEIK